MSTRSIEWLQFIYGKDDIEEVKCRKVKTIQKIVALEDRDTLINYLSKYYVLLIPS